MGAMVTLDWLNRYPREIHKAVLMSASLRGVSPFYQRLCPSSYRRLLYAMLLCRDLRHREALIFELTSNSNQKRDAIIDCWCDSARRHPITRRNILRQLFAAARYRVLQQKPDTEILLLAGLADALVNPQCSQDLAKLWRYPLEIHATAGHDLPLDAADWCCDKIVNWCNQTKSLLTN